MKQVQSLTGFLNFLNRAIMPGRAFTRRMYAKLSTKNGKSGEILKPHHHINLDPEFKQDARMWQVFLESCDEDRTQLCCPFLDQDIFSTSDQLNFYTDASGTKGFGCFFNGRWTFGMWDEEFIKKNDPSIEYLELFALCAGIFTWQDMLRNMRIVIFCDNQSVIEMVNKTT